MTEWPDGWYRDGSPGAQPAGGGAGAGDPTVRLRPGTGAAPGEAAPGQGEPPPGGWPDQPPPRTGRPGRAGRSGGGRSGWRRPRRWVKLIAGLIAAVLLVSVGLYFYLDSKLNRANVLVNYSNRPAVSAGSNWLITGSDSRQGLTAAQMRKYSTGRGISGHRSDTIMLLHVPANGTRSVLISLPRDSYVPIPGYGYNKLNAAYSFGGPKLLAQTVQNVTGLRIDHYMGIGFGGFVNVVNAVGGVRMCLPAPLNDKASGLHLKKGCQTLSGGVALSYVRDRHTYASQDLQRIQDQRLFLSALLSKATSPGVYLNPFTALPFGSSAASSIAVDKNTSLYDLIQAGLALRGPQTGTVPIADANYQTSAGDAVKWDSAKALQLFNALKDGKAVPAGLLTGTKAGT
jgi:LCP family protein required for cell wall assembly